MYSRNREPMVAPYDIKVLKYLRKRDDGGVVTPCQEAPVTFDEPLVAHPSIPQWRYKHRDNYDREIYSIGAGVIHAKLTPSSDYDNFCVEAIIPKGTKFWIDSFGNDIVAEKLVVTPKEVSIKKPFISPELAEIILKSAPQRNGIRVGDYQLTDDTFVSPKKGIQAKKVRGQVCGFYKDGTPMICAVERLEAVWDNKYGTRTTTPTSPNSEEAQKLFNGKEITELVKEKCPDDKDLEAFQTCINYRKHEGENWFFGALGEVMEMLDNALYLNAARAITGVGFVIDRQYWYWSCSEDGSGGSFSCGLGGSMVFRCWCRKDRQGSVVPFFASKDEKKTTAIKRHKLAEYATRLCNFFKGH